MPYHTSTAIILKSSAFGESDKLVTLFSPDLGKIKALAKGARKSNSKFTGRLEVFTHTELLMSKGRSLPIITQVETLESFYKLREDPDKLQGGIYILRLLDAATIWGIKNEELFNLLLRSLSLLKEGISPQVVTRIFEVLLIDIEGFFPNLKKCIYCKSPLKELSHIGFGSRGEGIVCSACARKDPQAIRVSTQSVEWLSSLQNKPWESLKDNESSQRFGSDLDIIIEPILSEHLGQDIRSFK